jgi:hypothetical protein
MSVYASDSHGVSWRGENGERYWRSHRVSYRVWWPAAYLLLFPLLVAAAELWFVIEFYLAAGSLAVSLVQWASGSHGPARGQLLGWRRVSRRFWVVGWRDARQGA